MARLSILFIGLLCLLVGCGDKEPLPTVPSEKTRQKEQVYAIARVPDLYPLQLHGRSKYLLAFCDELLAELAQARKLNFSIFAAAYSDMFDQLQRGTYDALLSTLPPTDANKELYDFSEPLIFLGPVLVVPENSRAQSVADMQGLLLLVPNDQELIIDVSKTPSILLKTYSDLSEALTKVSQGKADGVLAPALAAYTYTHGLYREKLKVVTSPLNNYALRLICASTSKRGQELITQCNIGLRSFKEDGVYYALRRKWRLKGGLE